MTNNPKQMNKIDKAKEELRAELNQLIILVDTDSYSELTYSYSKLRHKAQNLLDALDRGVELPLTTFEDGFKVGVDFQKNKTDRFNSVNYWLEVNGYGKIKSTSEES